MRAKSKIRVVDLRKAKPAQVFKILRSLMNLNSEKIQIKVRKVD